MPANSGNFLKLLRIGLYICFLYIISLASQKHKFTDRNPKVVFSASGALRIDHLVFFYMYDRNIKTFQQQV